MFLIFVLCTVFALMFLLDFRQIKQRIKGRTAVYFVIAMIAAALLTYCLFTGALIRI